MASPLRNWRPKIRCTGCDERDPGSDWSGLAESYSSRFGSIAGAVGQDLQSAQNNRDRAIDLLNQSLDLRSQGERSFVGRRGCPPGRTAAGLSG